MKFSYNIWRILWESSFFPYQYSNAQFLLQEINVHLSLCWWCSTVLKRKVMSSFVNYINNMLDDCEMREIFELSKVKILFWLSKNSLIQSDSIKSFENFAVNAKDAEEIYFCWCRFALAKSGAPRKTLNFPHSHRKCGQVLSPLSYY